MARNGSERASSLLGIESDFVAFDFDRCVTHRLLIYDNERRADEFEKLNMMLGGGPSDDSKTPVSDVEYM